MAKLYVFNPEHDLALAANLSNFTAPHAGRKLRYDLGYIPALWAGDEDYILVDDVEKAVRQYGRLRAKVGGTPKKFVDKSQLCSLYINKVEPWGWDLALRAFLLRYGVEAVPTEDEIAEIRELSHRMQAVELLSHLQMPGTIGTSCCVTTIAGVKQQLEQHGHIVVKAPWSSSGRGVRFMTGSIDDYQERWIKNIVEKQGAVVVEPYYHKVKDFGMEFESDGEGCVKYLGLSLFLTKNGAYTGNLITKEDEKQEMISRYIPIDLLMVVKEKVCHCLGENFKGKYQGPFGVDMMIVSTEDKDGFLLHPCVEINLRRTMGHVALAIPPFADGFTRVMHIELTDKYRMSVRKR
ncbi:hypothetical protein [Prevotella sp. P6B4]|uniref:hypothetical protein n=1 Tax=Prevotella sp. P6B4 TaxID=1410614 RepID=UPI000563BC03|nr:hypothetical protein [Prevotella sp. P6B4]